MATPEQPDVPPCAKHVWDWWQLELNPRRAAGFDSLAPISYGEIESWIRLTGKRVARVEIDWLIGMDNAWLSGISEERQGKQERERNKGSG